jgi:hypothetical protein
MDQNQNRPVPCLAVQAMELSHRADVQSGSRPAGEMFNGRGLAGEVNYSVTTESA